MDQKFQVRKREIFAITGLAPEVLAVAMAKYSRSPKTIKETINELTEEKSAQFHEKWVLGYGDASVADMAPIAIALENISILASKAVEDNRLAAYQEKSTRYQVFDKNAYYKPVSIMNSSLARLYEDTCNFLFDQYQKILSGMISYFKREFPRPSGLKEKLYQNKLRARALDVARYLLPASTFTNLGMIMNARSLRHCISKLLSSPLPEIQLIGKEIKKAALSLAYNPQLRKVRPLLNKLTKHRYKKIQEIGKELEKSLSLQVKGAPTLVKYTKPRSYVLKSRSILEEYAKKIFKNLKPQMNYQVDLISEKIKYEDELVASLLYPHTLLSFRQILKKVRQLPLAKKKEIIQAIQKLREKHDWPIRSFEVNTGFIFDTLMDYGAFRDLQRHRILTQLNQPLTGELGYEIPEKLEEAGLKKEYEKAIKKSLTAYKKIKKKFPQEAAYVLCLAFKKRTLFKMNLRELYHIIELRTKPGGHIYYRRLVYKMYLLFKKKYPLLAQNIKAQKPDFKKDFFRR